MMNNTINVALTLYNRPEYLHEQMECFANQTVADEMHLYVISNNPAIDFQSMLTPYMDRLKITFIQKDNSLRSMERHFVVRSLNLDYVMVIDDDMILYQDGIEKMYSCREKNTYKGILGRVFDFDNGKRYWDCQPIWHQNARTNYTAASFAIIDCAIFDDYVEAVKDVPTEHFSNIVMMDDLFLSWVINNKDDWKCYTVDVPVKKSYSGDSKAMFIEVGGRKDDFAEYLHMKSRWKPI